MLSCKEVTKLISQNLDRDLSIWTRLSLRLHMAMCQGCSAYKHQIESLNKLVSDHYRPDRTEADNTELSDDARERIKESLRSDQSRPS